MKEPKMKLLSLSPLTFQEAVADILKVKLEPRAKKREKSR